jgi:signal peptidase I
MNSVKNFIIELAETLGVSFVVIFLIYHFVASMEVVSGASMEPNFDTNERILVDRVSKYFKDYGRGEVVVIIPPTAPDKHYIKRIIGIPGDVIKIYECNVYVSRADQKFELTEPYLTPDTCTKGGVNVQEGRAVKLGPTQYLVLGDNRPFSVDSRFFGSVERDKILGRVIFRFWPPQKLGFIK